MTLELLSKLVKKHNNCLVVESVIELPKWAVDCLNKILEEDGTILISERFLGNTSIRFFCHDVSESSLPTWAYCNPVHYPNKMSNTEFLEYFKEPPKCLRRL